MNHLLQVHAKIGDEPLVVLCVLKGSYRFFNDLIHRLSALRASGEHPLIPDFVRVKSYANTASTGNVDIIGFEHVVPLKDQNVLVRS